MATKTEKRIDFEAIKSMAAEAAQKASRERGIRVIGSSTVVATYSGHEEASLREKKNIDIFFKNNKIKH
ncbi:hypothetical protein [Halomonas chromatireducens]|uniref:Uncharacterized protein n=1 Tax=Halomonas chromatireducens TaxID=507626 RepID=A0A120JVJ6_9GAMM|nr:hypothetical protein [Halomonas chromatireducens]AMC99361.1 hypothetical protein LOKO_00265 [Halomonas chromatireducens]